MLKFKKGNTTITITNNGKVLVATRFTTKGNRIVMDLSGDTIDMTTKVNRVVELPDDLFEEFARIQEEANNDTN